MEETYIYSLPVIVANRGDSMTVSLHNTEGATEEGEGKQKREEQQKKEKVQQKREEQQKEDIHSQWMHSHIP